MVVYTVHEQPDPPADRLDRAEALVFVRDGFSLSAVLLAPIWLAAKRLWLPLLGYLAAVTAVSAVAYALSLDPGWIAIALGTLHLLVGLEADTLERLQLGRRGFAMLGTVAGRNREECERRFLRDWLPTQPMIANLTGGSAGTLAAAGAGVVATAPRVRGGWRSPLGRDR